MDLEYRGTQEDAFEFLNKIFRQADGVLELSKVPNVVTDLFEGKLKKFMHVL